MLAAKKNSRFIGQLISNRHCTCKAIATTVGGAEIVVAHTHVNVIEYVPLVPQRKKLGTKLYAK